MVERFIAEPPGLKIIHRLRAKGPRLRDATTVSALHNPKRPTYPPYNPKRPNVPVVPAGSVVVPAVPVVHPPMHSRRFGRLGWPVSEVGYGLWGMGGWSGSEDDESLAALERSIELGCTFFDTALAYGNGKSEQLLGAGARSDIRASRCTSPPRSRRRTCDWPALAEYPLDEVFPADHIRASTETSLENLGVPPVDLQQLHVWTDAWAGRRSVEARGRRPEARRTHPRLRHQRQSLGAGQRAASALDTGLVDSVQVVYNLFDQNPEDELFPMCRERGVAVIARVPFDEGSLTGTMTRGMKWPEGDWRNLYFTPDKLDGDARPRRRGQGGPAARHAAARSWRCGSSWPRRTSRR